MCVDPTVGLLETLLVLEGRPISLSVHLDRLRKSAMALFEAPPPKALAPLMQIAASELKLGRLRATVSWPPLSKPQCRIEAEEVDPEDVFPSVGEGRSLHTVVATGSLGSHKWADRSWAENLDLSVGDSVPLLFSAQTQDVLETIRGNIFLLKRGALVTPALDGRILPGIARAQTIEIARDIGIDVAERPFTLDELFAADEVFTTGSVRGIEPISIIDDVEIRSGLETPRLAAKLRRTWL
jgi:para-aminobenzoate synthetase/4-amino-4-deoxychorismate lyase